MRIMRYLTTSCLILALLFTLAIPCFASTTSYYHGNDYSASKCYAKTTQTSDDYTIGAKITWQLAGSDQVVNGSLVSSEGAEVISYSSWLWGKTGQSFGYYYVDGVQAHKSTAWMDFDF